MDNTTKISALATSHEHTIHTIFTYLAQLLSLPYSDHKLSVDTYC